MGATYWPIANNRCQPGLLLHQDYDSRKTLSPGRLDRILDRECGARPTVVVVSACHAGVFIGRASKGDNRIWLTAARDDRVSFGCGAEYQYTYFDECVLGVRLSFRCSVRQGCPRMRRASIANVSNGGVDMRTVSSITSWSIVAGLILAPACFGQDVLAEEDQEQAEEAEAFHEPAGPVTRDNWIPDAGDRTFEGEQLLGDLWTFRCPKGASVSISADTKDDTDEGGADIRPILILLDGAGNIIASSGENDVNCTYTPVCGGACPVIPAVECGSGENHSIIVRDDGPGTTTDRLCEQGGGYTLTVEVVDAHGRQTVVDLGGGREDECRVGHWTRARHRSALPWMMKQYPSGFILLAPLLTIRSRRSKPGNNRGLGLPSSEALFSALCVFESSPGTCRCYLWRSHLLTITGLLALVTRKAR